MFFFYPKFAKISRYKRKQNSLSTICFYFRGLDHKLYDHVEMSYVIGLYGSMVTTFIRSQSLRTVQTLNGMMFGNEVKIYLKCRQDGYLGCELRQIHFVSGIFQLGLQHIPPESNLHNLGPLFTLPGNYGHIFYLSKQVACQ